MNNTALIFTHNFCESRLNNYEPPEIYNSLSALFMVFLPVIFGFPKNGILFNIAVLMQFNGVASCYYHYNLNWIGKQSDEISMILANYFGIWYLLKIYFRKDTNKINFYNRFNTIYMTSFISINTLSYMDKVFPVLFTIYILQSIYIIDLISKKYFIRYKQQLCISLIGCIFWFISELLCNNWTYLGHCIWHILFPLGFYKLFLQYDRANFIN